MGLLWSSLKKILILSALAAAAIFMLSFVDQPGRSRMKGRFTLSAVESVSTSPAPSSLPNHEVEKSNPAIYRNKQSPEDSLNLRPFRERVRWGRKHLIYV